MNTLRRARTQTLLARALTSHEARRYLSIRDIQLARRKQQQQKETQPEQPQHYPPPPRTTQDIAREKRRELQREKEGVNNKTSDTDAAENRVAVTGFDTRAINTGAVAIPALDVVLSGETPEYKWSIQGHENQIVEIDLLPGQSVVAETGAMLEMSAGVDMDTKARGGLAQSFKRMFTGQGLFLTEFTYNQSSGKGRTVFSSPYPSKILALDLPTLGGALICQKNAFLVGSKSIEIEIAFTKNFTSGFFGGEGFILQQLHGEGVAFVHAGGAVIKRELAPGETIRVSTGSLVAFQPSVSYDVQMIPGFKNILFGGEGIFLATLTGPGLVILQSLPFDRLVGAITSRLPNRGGGAGGHLPIPLMGLGGGGGNTQIEQQRNNSAVAASPGGGGSMMGGIGGALAGGMVGGMAAGAVGSMMGGGMGSGGGGAAPATATGAADAGTTGEAAGYPGDNAGYTGDNAGYAGDDAGTSGEETSWGDNGGDDWGGDD